MPPTSTLKEMVEVCWELSLSCVSPNVNQDCEGESAFHVNPSPPLLVRFTTCACGLTPTEVVYASDFLSSCITGGAVLMVTGAVAGLPATTLLVAGGAMLMVIGTVAGLPATTLPVIGSIALTVRLVVYDVPPGTPDALTIMSSETLAPPNSWLPAPAESEIKEGACASSAAVQFSGSPPTFVMFTA